MPSAAEVRARHPLTLRHVGDGFLEEYVAKGAGLPFVDYVNARFARGTIPDRSVRDLVRYEDDMDRVRALPPLAAQDAPLPADDVPMVLSPSIALIMYGADLPGVLESLAKGEPARPKPRRNWYLLVPRGGEVEVRHLEREEGWMLEWFRAPTPLSEVLAMLEEDRAPAEALWREGLLVKA